MQATSTSSFCSRSVNETFSLKTPSAFNCRILSDLVIFLGSGGFFLGGGAGGGGFGQ